MTYVIIDIETVENERAKELFAKRQYQAPANYKDPAKIEQAILEKRQADMDRAALHWWTGKIICICANVIGADVKPTTILGDDEAELLRSFFDWLATVAQKAGDWPVILGKNGETFDLPYIVGRALVHDLGLPEALRSRRPINDIDHIFGFSSQSGQRGALGDYAFGLGIAGKLLHGSQVGALYAEIQMGDADKWNELAAYCTQDVDIATTILRRYLKPYVSRIEPPVLELKPEDIPFG